ncbi:MAG: amidohydrolase family protein [Planctomycetes bacterium]|nr:amidohydrolase family protein [Planctomycetota bacterium]
MKSPTFSLVSILVATWFASAADAQAPRTAESCVVTPVKTGLAADAPAVSIVVEHGRIARIVPATDPLPPAMRVVDGKSQLAVPAFVDAATWGACATPEPKIDQDLPADMRADVQIDMRAANRKGVEPAFRAAAAFDFDASKQKAWRESGFGVVLAAPHGQILGGTSALAVTRDAAPRDAILAPDVFAHAAFAATGQGYPSTLMGYTAQLRQLFLDAQQHDELASRALAGRPGPRPAFDPELDALGPVVRRERRVACEAQLARDIERWLSLGDELGFDPVIVGGREAFKWADALARKRIPVILTLDWGDEPDDPKLEKKKVEKPDAAAEAAKRFVYQEPLGVREAKRAQWEERRDCAKVLAEKGVVFAFGTGAASASDLLGKVRKQVEAGLPRDLALRALTAGSAELLGAPRLGVLEAGRDADFALWTADPFAKDARVATVFVDGYDYAFDLAAKAPLEGKPDEGVDTSGAWRVEYVSSDMPIPPSTLELAMKPDGEVTGTLNALDPTTQAPVSGAVEGKVAQKHMRLKTSLTLPQFVIELAYDGELVDDAWKGTVTMKGPFGEQTAEFTGKKTPR